MEDGIRINRFGGKEVMFFEEKRIPCLRTAFRPERRFGGRFMPFFGSPAL